MYNYDCAVDVLVLGVTMTSLPIIKYGEYIYEKIQYLAGGKQ
jgi:hypothetical protein